MRSLMRIWEKRVPNRERFLIPRGGEAFTFNISLNIYTSTPVVVCVCDGRCVYTRVRHLPQISTRAAFFCSLFLPSTPRWEIIVTNNYN